MINKQNFFKNIRESLFKGKLTDGQVKGMESIIDMAGDMDSRQLAYCLATAYHETAKTMQPIEESGKGKNRTYGHRVKMSGKPYNDTTNIFYGRGFVQLTWYENYEKAGKKLDQDFIKNPTAVMEMNNAAKIMIIGMQEGWFSGKKLDSYINCDKTDFVNARRIINGQDKADLIADYAMKFFEAIN